MQRKTWLKCLENGGKMKDEIKVILIVLLVAIPTTIANLKITEKIRIENKKLKQENYILNIDADLYLDIIANITHCEGDDYCREELMRASNELKRAGRK